METIREEEDGKNVRASQIKLTQGSILRREKHDKQ